MAESLLLDTCALIWLATGSDELSKETRLLIAKAPKVFVSSVSAWELAIKCYKGKLTLPCDPRSWFTGVVEKYDLEVLGLGSDEMLAASELPWHHKDPADRFIIATAQKTSLPVVTGDGNFPLYGITVLR